MPPRPRLRDGLLITLTFAAGAVDALSYLGLGKVLVATSGLAMGLQSAAARALRRSS